MSNFNTLLVSEDDGVVRIILNRPDRLNALSEEMYLELLRVIEGMENNVAHRVLVVTGAGRAFCAGADVRELLKACANIESIQKRLRFSHGVVARLRGLRQPVIMAVNGDAIGGGCSMALNGDLRVASETARFGLTFNRVGLGLDMGSSYNLVRLVGVGKAFELASLGEIIPAKEAERIGLVNKVVAAEDLNPVVDEWAKRLAQSASLPLTLLKAALHRATVSELSSQLETEIGLQSLCMASQDGQEGLAAFLEKRKPAFGPPTGR